MPLIRNFGRNIEFRPQLVCQPADRAELLWRLEQHRARHLRCRGALHSWSSVIETDGVLFDLRGFRWVQVIGGAQPRVRVGAGCTLKRLLCELRAQGLTLPTLGAIKAQTVAGAVATGTHGSGKPSLSHFVEKVTLAHFDAADTVQVATIDSGDELLAARCALGSMGVVLELELAIVPRYRVKESVRKFKSLERARAGWNERRWPLTQFALMPWSWTYLVYRRKVSAADGWQLRLRAWTCRLWLLLSNDIGLHLVLLGLLACARLTGDSLIRWFFRLVPRLILTGPRRVDESDAVLTMHHDLFRHVEMELFVPESHLAQAVSQIRELVEIAGGTRTGCSEDFGRMLDGIGMRDEVTRLHRAYTLHYPLFFRRIEADEALVSMASGEREAEDWVSISFFTYRCRDAAFGRFGATVARCMMAFHGARPHWGKFFPIAPAGARAEYPRFDEFRDICRRYDDKGRFAYAMLDERS